MQESGRISGDTSFKNVFKNMSVHPDGINSVLD